MQENLKIALIQSDLVWEKPEENRNNFTEKIKAIPNDVDIVVLPEMFTTGFTMSPFRLAESMTGKTVMWMKELAKTKAIAIVGSVIIAEKGSFYNRLLFVEPSGFITSYNKRHTFTLAGEHKIYEAGKEKVILHYKGWKIRPLICYDLRFPVWSRNTENYDVLLYVANWPKSRISAWDILLKARAVENMCYCIGVNRVGLDGLNNEYPGHSAVCDVLGQTLTAFKTNEIGTQIATLSQKHITTNREKFRFLDDKDSFNFT